MIYPQLRKCLWQVFPTFIGRWPYFEVRSVEVLWPQCLKHMKMLLLLWASQWPVYTSRLHGMNSGFCAFQKLFSFENDNRILLQSLYFDEVLGITFCSWEDHKVSIPDPKVRKDWPMTCTYCTLHSWPNCKQVDLCATLLTRRWWQRAAATLLHWPPSSQSHKSPSMY